MVTTSREPGPLRFVAVLRIERRVIEARALNSSVQDESDSSE